MRRRILVYGTKGIGRRIAIIPFDNEEEIMEFLLWNGINLNADQNLTNSWWFSSGLFIFKVERITN